MKQWIRALIGGICLAGLMLFGLALFIMGVRELFPVIQVQERLVEVPVKVPAPVPPLTCMKFTLMGYWPEAGEFVAMAETELCGQELAWKDRAFGPSLVDKIAALENGIAAWKDCAESRQLCAVWQLEELGGK